MKFKNAKSQKFDDLKRGKKKVKGIKKRGNQKKIDSR
jgi:hypothetical protein